MSLTDKLSAIGEAIRAKTGKSDKLTLDQMPSEIAGITGGDVTMLQNVPINLNFASGDMVFEAPSGMAVKSAIVKQPTTLTPANIKSGVDVAGIVGTLSGGANPDANDPVYYVTFMNGNQKLYVRPVVRGEDCTDVVNSKIISTPTKDSDVQYNYTFYGWGASDGGGSDSNILKNITEDKTVYAIYTKTLQKYTITYLDDDGTTVLYSKDYTYGSDPSYIPEKEGNKFVAWVPEIAPVTGNASYQASWMTVETLEGATWARIQELSQTKEIGNYFAVGDTKSILLNGSYGGLTFNETYYVYILHMHDAYGVVTTYFGCFKNANGVDICLVNDKYGTSTASYMSIAGSYSGSSTYTYQSMPIRYYLGNFTSSWSSPKPGVKNSVDKATVNPLSPISGTLLACFPEAVRAVMKKESPATSYDYVGSSGDFYGSNDYLRLLGEGDIFGTKNYTSSWGNGSSQHFSYYKMSGVSPVRYRHDNPTTKAEYWIIGHPVKTQAGGTVSNSEKYNVTINTSGKVGYQLMTYSYGIAPVFAV